MTPSPENEHDFLREYLVEAMLDAVPFDGWSSQALNLASQNLGVDEEKAAALFPNGGRDFLYCYSHMIDRKMRDALEKTDLEVMPVRERILSALIIRFEILQSHRESARRAFFSLMLPQNADLSLLLLYTSVDSMWFATGDQSTDMNFYSKRLLLGGIYATALLVWLNDESNDLSQTRDFVRQRIEEVLKIPKITGKLTKLKGLSIKPPFSFCLFAEHVKKVGAKI